LNSGDDEDSDEGGDALFNVPNVVICQFDKVCFVLCVHCERFVVLQVSRTRNRWKFGFKDGLLDINNVDRAFHRASGEAEW
jgi:transcription initiation factor TFIIA large subunit